MAAVRRRAAAESRLPRRHLNDAGIGIDEAGIARLPALDGRGNRRRHGPLPFSGAHRRWALDLGERHRQRGQRAPPPPLAAASADGAGARAPSVAAGGG